ncbi:hypothetical protein TUZN_0460 [Thermoproteus uzoniensis 768-20]|uniref:Uncharacterized protein n=1 Tax=Thermoproteus uzoniensis (strain 768-20) TaxID=999630 RepID=F2L397_THEU7|nr:hypothetical protein [Thermoproteus uzoniensis]AEA11956.1 hypothetical protein TUZN_0460 [Thermoproteus uzoniensis 768-20]
MLLQIWLPAAIVALIAALIAAIFILNRRSPPQQQQPLRAYTPGEQEILNQLAYIRDRLEKFIPPYGRVGYIPSNAAELAQLLGFHYVKIGQEEYGNLPEINGIEQYLDLDLDEAQLKIKDKYIYIIKKNDKRLVAVGDTYLDYLTIKFLEDFLSYL